MLEPSHVAANRKKAVNYHSICVPLAIANAIQADVEDVLFMCVVLGLIRGGGMMVQTDVPRIFERLGSECAVTVLKTHRGAQRPTFNQFRERLRLDRRYVVVKNRHATYGCARFGYFDGTGVFKEARARVNVVVEITLEQARLAREGLARFMAEKRERMDVARILATCPNHVSRRRTRRTIRPRGTAIYRTPFGIMTMAQYRARCAQRAAT